MSGRMQRGGRIAATIGLAVIIQVLGLGYGFGIRDHAIHLPMLEAAMGTTPSSGDPLLELAHHPSLLWTLLAPLASVLGIPLLFAILQLVALIAAFFAVDRLARAIHGDDADTVAALAVLLVAVGGNTFASVPLLDGQLLHRGLVLGLEVGALAAALRARPWLTGLLLGLAFDLHPTTAVHAGLLVAVIQLARPTRWATAWRSGLVFLVVAAPLLWQMAHHPGDLPTPFPADWRLAVTIHFPLHHFIEFIDPNDYTSLLMPLVLIALAHRVQPAPGPRAVVVGTGLTILVWLVGSYLVRSPAVVQLHLLESTRFLYLVGLVALAGVVAAALRERPRGALGALLLLAGTLTWQLSSLSPYPLPGARVILLVAFGVGGVVVARWRPRPLARDAGPALTAGRLAIAGATLMALVLVVHRGPAGVSFTGPARAASSCRGELLPVEAPDDELCGLAAMRWLAAHGHAGDGVLIPPVLEHPLNDVRSRARLVPYWSFKDGGEATFSLAFARLWLARLGEVLGPELAGPLATDDDDGWWYRWQDMFVAYRKLDAPRLRALAARAHGPRWAIIEHGAGALAGLSPAYRDRAFDVYDLR